MYGWFVDHCYFALCRKLLSQSKPGTYDHVFHALLLTANTPGDPGVCFTNKILPKPILNSLRPRRNRRYNADDIFKWIFLNENVWIPIKISLKFVPKGPSNNIPALVQIMAWRRSGDKPSSEPMMVSLLTHICVTRPQWVNETWVCYHLNILELQYCRFMCMFYVLNHI